MDRSEFLKFLGIGSIAGPGILKTLGKGKSVQPEVGPSNGKPGDITFHNQHGKASAKCVSVELHHSPIIDMTLMGDKGFQRYDRFGYSEVEIEVIGLDNEAFIMQVFQDYQIIEGRLSVYDNTFEFEGKINGIIADFRERKVSHLITLEIIKPK